MMKVKRILLVVLLIVLMGCSSKNRLDQLSLKMDEIYQSNNLLHEDLTQLQRNILSLQDDIDRIGTTNAALSQFLLETNEALHKLTNWQTYGSLDGNAMMKVPNEELQFK